MSSAVERGEISLEEVKNQRSTTPPEERDRCPECLAASIVEKQMPVERRERPEDFRCENAGCAHHFNEPVSGINPNNGGHS